MAPIKSVLISGGAGYVGSLLAPQLLAKGYRVVVFDIMYFGDEHLPKSHPQLSVIRGDIRDAAAFGRACAGVDAVISLACISNDASFELDEELSTSTNMDAFDPMLAAAKAAGVKRFIYASSSSVYGVSDAPEVTEDHPLVPLTLYNKYKGLCEPLLMAQADDSFTCVAIRPATICGVAPRQRLDLSVNILTNHAITNGKILIFGGTQLRPNLHIKDMCRLYRLLLKAAPETIQCKVWNAGYQNRSIGEIARIVKQVVSEEYPERPEIQLETSPSDDLRSYHINSSAIERELGFRPENSIEDAVRDLCKAFKAGLFPDSMQDDRYYNVRKLKRDLAANTAS